MYYVRNFFKNKMSATFFSFFNSAGFREENSERLHSNKIPENVGWAERSVTSRFADNDQHWFKGS
ncbi:MAG: hypothetical protein B6245_13225 [Desulfobacteraceae bacterium 4572_88]|nr:MAG: hypothetical protein B6245_13225 [Desulfobacteraceae bacterium 4572_88]